MKAGRGRTSKDRRARRSRCRGDTEDPQRACGRLQQEPRVGLRGRGHSVRCAHCQELCNEGEKKPGTTTFSSVGSNSTVVVVL